MALPVWDLLISPFTQSSMELSPPSLLVLPESMAISLSLMILQKLYTETLPATPNPPTAAAMAFVEMPSM